MRINHNINALNSWRNITMVNMDMSKTLERLSSGLRINRAGDDAAGLAISEKMRGQIRGLEMAVKNAQDAISLIQTAEGALTEVHSILQRMRELAVQAASDTNTNVDRNQIQAELDQLREEIDRIARTTEFNTKKLLDGKIESFRAYQDVKVVTGGNFDLKVVNSGSVTVLAANSGTTLANIATSFTNGTVVALRIGNVNVGNVTIDISGATVYVRYAGQTLGSVAISNDSTNALKTLTLGDLRFEFTLSDASTGANVKARVERLNITLTTSKAAVANVNFTDVAEGSYIVEVGQFRGAQTSALDVRINYFNETGLASAPIVDFSQGRYIFAENQPNVNGSLSTTNNGFFLTLTASTITGRGIIFTWDPTVYNINSFGDALPTEAVIDSGVVRAEERNYRDTSLVFQIGANEGHNMIAGLDDMRAAALGLTRDSLKVTDQNSAERTIMVIDAAIHKVSTARAALGAVQNRLEHTIANLGVAAENLTAAESRIRDADMAKEMMQFTKQQILLQSSMAMLAQANAQPQNVLQLLR
ncbi:flagellin [Fervidobacterium thailandense]|uniref:Flagellin n=1 Tax=Fervidobacterium thailandense TaxID=1008305 RepID=A0A1E3G4M7_9BACT|nr:hypothetical protein A4H02_05005 [Fervidobacterium thailandense]